MEKIIGVSFLVIFGGFILANISLGLWACVLRQKNYKIALALLVDIEGKMSVLKEAQNVLDRRDFIKPLDDIDQGIFSVRQFILSHSMENKIEWDSVVKALRLLVKRLEEIVPQMTTASRSVS